MRLIDEDSFKKFLTKLYEAGAPYDGIIELLDKQPTAYDLDKVVEELENEREYAHADFEQYAELHGIDTEDDWFYAGMRRAIEIVKAGGTND